MLQPEIDKLLKRRLYVQRFVSQVFNEVTDGNLASDKALVTLLAEFIADADEKTLQALSRLRRGNAAARQLISEITKINNEQRATTIAIVEQHTKSLIERELIVTQNAVNPDHEPPSSRGLSTMAVGGLSLNRRFTEAYSRTLTRIIADISTAASTNPDSILRIVRGTRAERLRDGIFHWRNERLIRTNVDLALNGAAANSAMRVYEAEKVEKVRWIATLDYRACVVCRNNEANSPHAIDSAPPLLAHPNCRCIRAPYIERQNTPRPFVRDDRPVSQIPRSERGGGKIGQTQDTIEQFFSRMSDADLRDYLGETRYKLLKAGKIKSVGDLVNERTFRPLTLDQLPEL